MIVQIPIRDDATLPFIVTYLLHFKVFTECGLANYLDITSQELHDIKQGVIQANQNTATILAQSFFYTAIGTNYYLLDDEK